MSYVIEEERRRIPPSPSKLGVKQQQQQQSRGRVPPIQETELAQVSIFQTQVPSLLPFPPPPSPFSPLLSFPPSSSHPSRLPPCSSPPSLLSPIPPQEILLFNASNFLYLLLLESPKIRRFLSVEMEGIWFGIMHSLNLILPRPDEDEKKTTLISSSLAQPTKPISPPVSPTRSRPAAATGRGRARGEGAGGGGGSEGGDGGVGSPEKEKSNFLKKLFRSNDSEDDKESNGNGEDNDEEEEEELEDINDPDLNISIKERNLLYPPLLLREYGKPLYQHLSRGSWELLLASRCHMEQMVKMLELEVSVVSHLPIIDQGDREDEVLQLSQLQQGQGQGQGRKKNPRSTSPPSGPWRLDSSIPINGQLPLQQNVSHTPSTPQTRVNSKAVRTSGASVGDELSDLPTIHQSTSPRLKSSSSPPRLRPQQQPQQQPQEKRDSRPIPVTFSIQQRLDSHVTLPYHVNDDNRFRRQTRK
jgi:hypothetical protein